MPTAGSSSSFRRFTGENGHRTSYAVSTERVTQALEIIESIRTAYGRSNVLTDDLKHLSPPAIIPGSLDHLRFLVEFVDENKSIIRSR